MPETNKRIIDVLRDLPLSGPEQRSLLIRVVALIEEEVLRERQRCVQRCRDRAELWRTTLAARDGGASAQEQARGRGNEALYLADLLELGDELKRASVS